MVTSVFRLYLALFVSLITPIRICVVKLGREANNELEFLIIKAWSLELVNMLKLSVIYDMLHFANHNLKFQIKLSITRLIGYTLTNKCKREHFAPR